MVMAKSTQSKCWNDEGENVRATEAIVARGHRNILATNETTFEITTAFHLSKRGDCIVAVASNKSVRDLSDEFQRLLRHDSARLTIRIEAGSTEDVAEAWGDSKLVLTHCADSVVRKSNYICDRTLAVKADKAAKDLSRQLVEELKNPQRRVDITLSVEAAR
jgi:hypothetical protein